MEDAQGLKLDCRTDEAAAILETAIEDLLTWRSSARRAAERATRADRRSRLAQAVRAYELLCHPGAAGAGPLGQALARGGEGRPDPRGEAHLTAARHWAAGKPVAAAAALERWLLEAPRDLLALAMVQRLYLALGDADNLRDAPARLLDAWDAEDPGYGALLARYAWGLAEAGQPSEAEAVAVEALQRDVAEPTAVLAAAAALEQGGRLADAQEWFALQAPAWRDADRLAPQVLWHLGALRVDAGRTAAALETYDTIYPSLLPAGAGAGADDAHAAGPERLAEAVGLLWRLELVGADVGARWEPLLAGFAALPDDALDAQAALAAVMAAATGGGIAELTAALDGLERLTEGDGHRAVVLRAVGLPLARALVAFAQHRAEEAVAALLPLRGRLALLGGTRAQRDLFAQTLIYAAVVAGEHRLARALLSERRARRPNSPQTWQASAANFEALGEAGASQAALARVRDLLAA